MPKTPNYSKIAGTGVRDTFLEEMQSMNSIAKNQQVGLATVAKDVAADKLRAAGAYAQQQANTRGAIGAGLSAFSGILGGIDFGGGGGGGGLGIADSSPYDLNQNFFSGGSGPSFADGLSWDRMF